MRHPDLTFEPGSPERDEVKEFVTLIDFGVPYECVYAMTEPERKAWLETIAEIRSLKVSRVEDEPEAGEASPTWSLG